MVFPPCDIKSLSRPKGGDRPRYHLYLPLAGPLCAVRGAPRRTTSLRPPASGATFAPRPSERPCSLWTALSWEPARYSSPSPANMIIASLGGGVKQIRGGDGKTLAHGREKPSGAAGRLWSLAEERAAGDADRSICVLLFPAGGTDHCGSAAVNGEYPAAMFGKGLNFRHGPMSVFSVLFFNSHYTCQNFQKFSYIFVAGIELLRKIIVYLRCALHLLHCGHHFFADDLPGRDRRFYPGLLRLWDAPACWWRPRRKLPRAAPWRELSLALLPAGFLPCFPA